jgi:hypothetical protein
LPIVAIIGGGLLLMVLAAGGMMWMKRGKPAPSTDLTTTPVSEPPVVANATPAPITPPVVRPTENRPVAPAGTVAVAQLADLASQGPLRETTYLTGEFTTTSAQGTSAVFRPTVEANGPLAGQIRVVADYPENATLPAEGSRVTITPAMRCRVISVRRGTDKQINVDARMEK